MFDKDEDEDEDPTTVTAVRYPCMPSLVMLQLMRNRLHLAHTGMKLMKWTAMATGKELRRMARMLTEEYATFHDETRDCFILLARGRYFCPSLNDTVLNNLEEQAGVTVQKNWKSLIGVKVLNMTALDKKTDTYPHLGIGQGGNAIFEAKAAWRKLLKLLVFMAQARVQFEQLEIAYRNATKRQNIISKVIMPRLNVTNKYILSELEEKEREETFRLKRFKELKIKKARIKKEKDLADTAPTNICEYCSNQADKDPSDTCKFCSKVKSPSDDGKIIYSESMETMNRNDKGNVVTSDNSKKLGDENATMKDILSHIDDIIDFITKTFENNKAASLNKGPKRGPSATCDLCQEIMKVNDSKDVSATQSLEIKPEKPCCTEDALGKDTKVSFEIKPSKTSQNEEKLPVCETCRTNMLAINSKASLETKTPKIGPIRSDLSICKVCRANASPNKNNSIDKLPKPKTQKDNCKVCKQTPDSKVSKTCTSPKKSSKNMDPNKKSTVSVSIKNVKKLPCQETKSDFNDNELGSFEKQFKEIVRVTRSQNADGSISEEKKIITIRTERRTPLDRKSKSKSGVCAKSESNITCGSTSSLNRKTGPKRSKTNVKPGSSTLVIVAPSENKVCARRAISPKLTPSMSSNRSCSRSNSFIIKPSSDAIKQGKSKVCCNTKRSEELAGKKSVEQKVCCDTKSKEEVKPKSKAVPPKLTFKDACVSTTNLKIKPPKPKKTSSSTCISRSSSASISSSQGANKMVLISRQACGCQSVNVIPNPKKDWLENLLKDVDKPVQIAIKESLRSAKSVILVATPSKKTSGRSLASCHSDMVPKKVGSTSDSKMDRNVTIRKTLSAANSKKILKNVTNSGSVCCTTHKESGTFSKVKDASTNTKRSTRFDVRGVSSSPIKPRKSIALSNCVCKSDTDLLTKKKRPLWMSK